MAGLIQGSLSRDLTSLDGMCLEMAFQLHVLRAANCPLLSSVMGLKH